jgi:hypothetical protein
MSTLRHIVRPLLENRAKLFDNARKVILVRRCERAGKNGLKPVRNHSGGNHFCPQNALGTNERVSTRRGTHDIRKNSLVTRTHPCNATEPLLHSRRGPRKIEMNHHTRVLEIYPFAQDVCCEQKRHGFRRSRCSVSGRLGCEARDRFGARNAAPGDSRSAAREKRCRPIMRKQLEKSFDRVCVLGESDNSNAFVLSPQFADYSGALEIPSIGGLETPSQSFHRRHVASNDRQ